MRLSLISYQEHTTKIKLLSLESNASSVPLNLKFNKSERKILRKRSDLSFSIMK